jgi:hypothetical protein
MQVIPTVLRLQQQWALQIGAWYGAESWRDSVSVLDASGMSVSEVTPITGRPIRRVGVAERMGCA